MAAIDLTDITTSPTTRSGGTVGTTYTQILLPKCAATVTVRLSAAGYIGAADGLEDGGAVGTEAFPLASGVSYAVACGITQSDRTLGGRSSIFVAAASGTADLKILVEVRS